MEYQLAARFGLNRSYFANVALRGATIPTERLAVVAEMLDTTMAYLNGETEVKEKPTAEYDDELLQITEIFSGLSPKNRAKLTELGALFLFSQHQNEEKK